MYDLWNKVARWWLYLRTRYTTWPFGSRRRIKYTSYVQSLCNPKNQGGHEPDNESETSEIINFRFERIKNPTPIWKELKMEEKAKRNYSGPLNWRQFIDHTQKAAEANAVKNGDPVPAITKASLMASVMLEKEVTAHDVSIIMMCISLAKVSEDRLNPDLYRDVITTSAHTAQFAKPVDGSFAELRIMSDLANQLAAADAA